MGISEKWLKNGGLYSDERLEENIQLNDEAQPLFQEYITELKRLGENLKNREEHPDNISIWHEWETGLRNLYKRIVQDAFRNLDIKKPKGMEIHFAGSLAKAR